MLNAKALSELLSKNSDDRLYKRWYLMTPNGTLLAYTQPTDIKELRKQVALAALTWQEHHQATHSVNEGGAETQAGHHHRNQLLTLIIQSEKSNVLVRRMQSDLLLVLEGGVPPRKRTFEARIIAEGMGDDAAASDRPDPTPTPTPGTSASSKVDSGMSSAVSGGVLGLHRKKLDAMAAAIAADFERTGFKMPDDSVNQFF